MRDPNPCRIIGILDDGIASLSPTALAYLRSAEVVIGGTRTLKLLSPTLAADAECLDLTGRLSAVPEWIRDARDAQRKVVVLATGDPLCHGIASYLASQVCIEALDILPNVSTLQLACARIGLPWHDARIVSVHARDAGEWEVGAPPSHGLYELAQAARHCQRLLVLTSPANTPQRIARMLLAEGMDNDFHLAVAECLATPEERISADLSPADVAQLNFADPNVVLLWRTQALPSPVLLGLPESAYHQRQPEKGLITKQEVRAVSLARMQLRRDSIVWDIGAGSGSVGLEAARLCSRGHVWAIEKNVADAEIAERNRRVFAVSNYTLVHGKAPEHLDRWPAPDAVFIGGSGGELGELIALVLRRLKPGGTLVMNFVTIENLAAATQALSALDAHWDVIQLQAARSKPILHMHRMAAENPVWIVSVGKGVDASNTGKGDLHE